MSSQSGQREKGETLLSLHFPLKRLLLTEMQDWGTHAGGSCTADLCPHRCQSSFPRCKERKRYTSRKPFHSSISLFVFFTYINISVRKQQSVSFHHAVKDTPNKIGEVRLLLPKYSHLFLNHIHDNCCIHFLHLCLCERNLGRNYLDNVFLIFLVYSTLFVQSHYDSRGRF